MNESISFLISCTTGAKDFFEAPTNTLSKIDSKLFHSGLEELS
jgi:hypothetical protein